MLIDGQAPLIAGVSASLMLHNGEAAFAASAVATAVLHPLDTIKSRLQSDAYRSSGSNTAALPFPPMTLPRLVRRRPTPSGTSQQPHTASPMGFKASARTRPARAGSRQRLFRDVYTGLPENVLKEAPDAAIYLAVCEQLSQSLSTNAWFASHLTLTLLLAGAIGDAVGTVVRLPAEVVCKRLQTGCASSVFAAFSDVSRDSWLACWSAILLRDVPLGGLQVAVYSASHAYAEAMASSLSPASPDAVADVIAGMVAGAAAAALTTPLDVVVTHTTTQPRQPDGGQPANALQVGLALVAEQGPLTLTRGMGLRVLYYAPLVGCFFGLYEYFRELLDAMGA